MLRKTQKQLKNIHNLFNCFSSCKAAIHTNISSLNITMDEVERIVYKVFAIGQVQIYAFSWLKIWVQAAGGQNNTSFSVEMFHNVDFDAPASEMNPDRSRAISIESFSPWQG